MVITILAIVVLAIIAANAAGKCPLWPAALIIALYIFWSVMPK